MTDANLTQGRLVLTDERLLDYLVSKAAETANKQIKEREERRTKVLATLLSLFGLVGFGTVWKLVGAEVQDKVEQRTTLIETRLSDQIERKFAERAEFLEKQMQVGVSAIGAQLTDVGGRLKEDMKLQAGNAVAQTIGDVRSELEMQAAYQQFAYLALSLDIRDRFPDRERDAAMSLLRTVSTSRAITTREEFPVHVEKVIDAFAAANQEHEVDEIESLLESTLSANKGYRHNSD